MHFQIRLSLKLVVPVTVLKDRRLSVFTALEMREIDLCISTWSYLRPQLYKFAAASQVVKITVLTHPGWPTRPPGLSSTPTPLVHQLESCTIVHEILGEGCAHTHNYGTSLSHYSVSTLLMVDTIGWSNIDFLSKFTSQTQNTLLVELWHFLKLLVERWHIAGWTLTSCVLSGWTGHIWLVEPWHLGWTWT